MSYRTEAVSVSNGPPEVTDVRVTPREPRIGDRIEANA